jgi:hypothetical protein
MPANLESGTPPMQADIPSDTPSFTAVAASGPRVEDQSGPQDLWIILPASLVLALAAGELCLGFIQEKVPCCKIPFAVYVLPLPSFCGFY